MQRPSGFAAGGGFHCGLDESGSGCATHSVGRATPPLAPNRPLCAGFSYPLNDLQHIF